MSIVLAVTHKYAFCSGCTAASHMDGWCGGLTVCVGLGLLHPLAAAAWPTSWPPAFMDGCCLYGLGMLHHPVVPPVRGMAYTRGSLAAATWPTRPSASWVDGWMPLPLYGLGLLHPCIAADEEIAGYRHGHVRI